MVDSDKSLYLTAVRSDLVHEGKVAGERLGKEVGDKPCNVVERRGTTGSSPAIDRRTDLEQGIAGHDNIKSRAARPATSAALRQHLHPARRIPAGIQSAHQGSRRAGDPADPVAPPAAVQTGAPPEARRGGAGGRWAGRRGGGNINPRLLPLLVTCLIFVFARGGAHVLSIDSVPITHAFISTLRSSYVPMPDKGRFTLIAEIMLAVVAVARLLERQKERPPGCLKAVLTALR